MTSRILACGTLLLVVTAGSPALAQSPAEPEPEPAPEAEEDELGLELEPEELSPSDVAVRLQRTEDLVRNRRPTVDFFGFVDAGFFVPQGEGVGYVQDFAHERFPEYQGRFGWVFLGDILAPAVNSRGEAADLGDAPGVDRFDSVNSHGSPSFIINELNVSLRSAITPTAIASASAGLLPRTGSEFRLGDVFDVDLAQVEWLPTASQRTSLFFGKMDSVIGIEYRDRKATRRFGITPSLIARYTTGTALGIKARTKIGTEDWLVVAAALTNGSNTTEQFHFYDEIDSNAAKTGSARISARIPVGVEIGFSGSYGAQDRSLSSRNALWFWGPDLLGHFGPLDVKVQWLKGRSPGSPLEDVYGLDLRGGGYAELDYSFGPTLGVIGRIEYRDAFVWLRDERAYLTKSWRATAGMRWVMSERAVLKAELLHNGEYGDRMPSVENDIFTSSLVLSY